MKNKKPEKAQKPEIDRNKSIFETVKYSYSLGLISEADFNYFKDVYEKSKNPV